MSWRAAVLAGIALLATGCTTPEPGIPDAQGIGFQAGDGSVTVLPAGERQPVPELRGEDLDGAPLSVAEHRGNVVVLNVWASWCAPCRAEAPALVEASKQRPDAVFLGLNTRDEPDAARAFVRTSGITWPSFRDADGSLLLGFGQLPPNAIPTTLVVDADGRVAARIMGEVTAATLTGVIDDVEAG